MNRFLEAYPGSPINPDVLGDAQYAQQEGKVNMYFPPLQEEGELYTLPVTRETNALGEPLVTVFSYQKDPTLSLEQNMLNAYKAAYPEALQSIHDVQNTGLLPDSLGAELSFETVNEKYFTSAAPTTEQAVYEAVLFQVSQNQ